MKKEKILHEKKKLEQLALTYSGGIHLTTGASRTYQGKIGAITIVMEVYTPKSKTGNWGKGKATYYIGKEKAEYKTVEELKVELLKRELILPD